MIKIEYTEVVGIGHAIRGMRNPMNSWDKSDSEFIYDSHDWASFRVGEKDMELAQKLNKGGSVHAKYRRMIVVYCDIVAPLYWWKEFDTYRAGVEKNSCSTMHKIHSKEFTMDDFSTDHLDENSKSHLQSLIYCLERARIMMKNSRSEKNKKEWWWQMIQLLPSSYNQRRTVMMSYEALANMYRWRKDHKLDEWRTFCSWIESLPYSEIITGGQSDEQE